GIDDQPDRHAGVLARDDLADVALVLHEPETDVDADVFGADQVDEGGATVLKGRVAQRFGRARRRRYTRGQQRTDEDRGVSSETELGDHARPKCQRNANGTAATQPAMDV